MGDRANAVVLESYGGDHMHYQEGVFLYTHWDGTELPETLRQGLLAGRGRWDDDQYLSRIIFDTMIGDDQGDETGYGISTRKGDGEKPLLVVKADRLFVLPEEEYKENGFKKIRETPDEVESIALEDYCLMERSWDNLTSIGATAEVE